MWYLIYCEDNPGSLALRQKNRPAHLVRLQTLIAEGRLLIAGPHPAIDSEDPADAGFTGTTVIAKFSSLEEAKKWADEDPYQIGGVYGSVTVKPLKITAKPECAFF